MTDMQELIKRLEKATEGHWKLDVQIADHLFGATWDDGASRPPPYTTSVDAALTLVPEGAAWALVCDPDKMTTDNAPHLFRFTVMPPVSQEKLSNATHYSPAPALALCIAALKARHA